MWNQRLEGREGETERLVSGIRGWKVERERQREWYGNRGWKVERERQRDWYMESEAGR